MSKYKVGEKVLIVAVIEEVRENKNGISYEVKPDDEKQFNLGMTVPEELIKSSEEIEETIREKLCEH